MTSPSHTALHNKQRSELGRNRRLVLQSNCRDTVRASHDRAGRREAELFEIPRSDFTAMEPYNGVLGVVAQGIE